MNHKIEFSSVVMIRIPISETITNVSNFLDHMDDMLHMAEVEMSGLSAHLDAAPKSRDSNSSMKDSNQMNSDNEDFVAFNNCTKEVGDCTNNIMINGSMGSLFDTIVNNSQPSCATDISLDCIRYYVEGVLLAPLCIFGFFGK